MRAEAAASVQQRPPLVIPELVVPELQQKLRNCIDSAGNGDSAAQCVAEYNEEAEKLDMCPADMPLHELMRIFFTLILEEGRGNIEVCMIESP